MSEFKLRIVTPEGEYFSGMVEICNVRTKNGQMGILAHRLPLAATLEISEMNIVSKGERTHYAIAGGFIYVGNDQTTIITDAIESQMAIDLERASAAKKRAQDRLSQQRNDQIDMQRAQIALKKAVTRIAVKNM